MSPADDPPTAPPPLVHRALVFLAAALLSVCTPLFIDGLRVVARGAPWSTLLPLHGMAVALGLAAAVGLGLLAALAFAGGWLIERLGRRLGLRVPASRWVAVAVALPVLVPLNYAHFTMAKHPVAALVFSGYALALFALLALFYDRWRPALGRHPRAVAVGGLLAGLLVHTVNATAYVNLYAALHRALTAVGMLGWLAVWWVLLARGRRRALIGLVGAVAVSGLLLGAVAGRFPVERAAAAVYGTESRHALELVDLALDGDGDGLSAPPVGVDCDDADPAVHPLAFEEPGNGKDDNCRLGDAPPDSTAPPLRPPLPPSAAAQAWRAAHPTADVFIIFVDTLRADALGRGDTPHIDALAARAVHFTAARTTVGRTPHAWMSLIRGRFLERTLACREKLHGPGPHTLVHRMRAAGWRTVARLVGRSWAKFHLSDGWDVLREAGHVKRQTGAAVADDILRLTGRVAGPVFAVAHFADPHAPYRDADGQRHTGSLVEGYRADVRYADAQIGRLLDGLAARPAPPLIVLFADHGENLGERGQSGGHHGGSVFDEVLRVPLMVAGPGIAPRRIDAPVSIADIAPTILELTGQAPLPFPDGRSLAGLIFGDGPPPGPVIGGFFDFGHRLRAIVDGRFKLVVDARRGARLLFDVVADPAESRNLLTEQPAEAARMQGLLDRWLEHEADPVGRHVRCSNLVFER